MENASQACDKLRECPFCGGNDLELKDYTNNDEGFIDYRIQCKTCRAYMDSPPTTSVKATKDGNTIQARNEETKSKARRELIVNWNRRNGEKFELLKERMSQFGISQKELAARLGTVRSRINEKLAGKREFTWSEIKQISDILEIKDVFEYFE